VRVLTINAGSSSLRHALVDTGDDTILARGEQHWDPAASAGWHTLALRAALADAGGRAEAVGHRVVHGGGRFDGPARIDDAVRASLAELAPLAPLHARAALEGIDAARAALPGVAQVACFDSAFHRTLAAEAATYALPRAWSERFGLRRYGFHGLNVAWCSEQATRILGAQRCRRLVVCHLGSGCSVSAVLDGRSVDTTMGFTPLDGVPMATRSGSIDPGLLLHLLARGIERDELDDALNHRSGLLGLAGLAGIREVERAATAGAERAQLAFDVLVRGVSGAVAAMTTSLRGLDALVFSAGAGERSAGLRGAICARLGQVGVVLDETANARHAERVAAAGARVAVLVVPAGEETVIARQTASVLRERAANQR
jgi:acetate kinase